MWCAVVYSHGLWLRFDDEKVNTIDEETIATCFGVTHDAMTNTETVSLPIRQTDRQAGGRAGGRAGRQAGRQTRGRGEEEEMESALKQMHL